MSLMPNHLPKSKASANKQTILTTHFSWLVGFTISLLCGCQGQPAANPNPSPTVTATPTTSSAIAPAEPEGILERVKARGKLICGVNGKLIGFSYVDEKGGWSGLDVDYCKAIAAAVLGDAGAIEFKPLLAKDRFTAIQNGEVDILMRNTTRTLTRDIAKNISFAPTTFFDGQGIMLRIGAKPTTTSSSPSPTSSPSPSPTTSPASNVSSDKNDKSFDKSLISKSPDESAIVIKDLANKKICVETGINATNLESAFTEANIQFNSVVLPDLDGVLNAYVKGECEAVSSEKSQLAAWRSKLPRPADHKILDLSLSKEPLSPALVGNDDRWRDIVTWVIYATFYAEELGISTDNYTIFKDTKNPEVAKFLGTSDSLGIELGLAPDWTTQILKQVGNYSDIYKRNLTPLDIPRGLNRNWKQGGLLYAMPFR
ncbi:amino acid ABC transporter substrate-binding protein [Pseudanabaena biceps]|nr:amino acid ABC transporter substrate-binding protein [Pseudanabaena biceps]